MLAEHAGKPVAGALNLAGTEALYGRNWGCRGDWPFLHFELCYYRAIDWAIEHGLQRVEAGAQGRHKIQRGYLPKPTYSAHWIAHAGLRRAVGDFLDDERPASAPRWRRWRSSRRSARTTDADRASPTSWPLCCCGDTARRMERAVRAGSDRRCASPHCCSAAVT